MLFQDNCYFYQKRQTNWEESQAGCEQCGANLASIHSKEEVDFLRNQISITNLKFQLLMFKLLSFI